MIVVPIFWDIKRRNNLLLVVDIVGRCKDASTKRQMLFQIVQFIEIAEKFSGKYFNDVKQINSVKEDVIVAYTSYIFPSEKMLAKFFEYLKKV